MTNTCVTLLNPISTKQEATLYRVATSAASLGVPALLCGAFARDVLFWHMHGIETERATMDLDVSIQVDGWDGFNMVREQLIKEGFTTPVERHPEKMLDPQTSMEVDLLPFGEISEDGATVIWPADSSRWSIIGFDDALRHSLALQLECDNHKAQLSLIPIPALVMLKIIATHDRPADRYKKDATDIGFVIRNYRRTTIEDPLKTPEGEDILNRTNSDLDLAVAMHMGREIRAIASPTVIAYVSDLLAAETSSQSRCYLARGLQKAYGGGHFPRARQILKAVADGLTDNSSPCSRTA